MNSAVMSRPERTEGRTLRQREKESAGIIRADREPCRRFFARRRRD